MFAFSYRLAATGLVSTALLLCPACKKSADDDKPKPPPGAKNEDPNILEVDYAKLDYENDGSFTMEGAPFNGRAIQTYADGKLKSRYDMVGGRFEGIVEEWYPNGVRSALKMYKNGVCEGITIYWKEDGEPDRQVLYEGGEEKKEITDIDELKRLGL